VIGFCDTPQRRQVSFGEPAKAYVRCGGSTTSSQQAGIAQKLLSSEAVDVVGSCAQFMRQSQVVNAVCAVIFARTPRVCEHYANGKAKCCLRQQACALACTACAERRAGSPPSAAVCSRAIACISSTSRCGRWMPCPSVASLPNRRMLSMRCSAMPAFNAASTGSSGGPLLAARSDCTLELLRRNVGARSATASSVMHGR